MDEPFDRMPAAGFPQDAEPGPDSGRAAQLAEAAVFVRLHLGRGPGVLWSRFDRPLFGSGARAPDDDVLPQLAAFLRQVVGVRTRHVPEVPPPTGHLLACQASGVSTWWFAHGPPDTDEPVIRYRLLAGGMLYVPAGWTRTVHVRPPHRCVVLSLEDDRSAG